MRAVPTPGSTSPTFDAVVFDFDGTLVDTMPIHFAAYRGVFEELGLELSEDTFYAHVGGKATETIPKLLAGQTSPLPTEEIHRRKLSRTEAHFREGPITPLETAKLLPLLHGRVPLAIASSGSRRGIDLLLQRLGWAPYFRAIVSGDDVRNGKPAPDAFLAAAQAMAVPPERCLAFEDTDAGVQAARSAGMSVVDVRGCAGARR